MLFKQFSFDFFVDIHIFLNYKTILQHSDHHEQEKYDPLKISRLQLEIMRIL